MTDRPILSATQLEAFKCERAGAFVYNLGHRTPPAPGMLVGTRVHQIAEAWLKEGKEPDALEVMTLTVKGKVVHYLPGQIFQQAVHLTPPPGAAISEGDFRITTPKADWRGARDFVTMRDAAYSWGSPHWGVPEGARIVVGDFKTTSSKRYALTADPLTAGWEADEKTRADRGDPGRLLANVQGNLYAYGLMQEYGVSEVDARWIYMLTTGRPTSWPVDVTFEKSAVDDAIGKIDVRAERLYQIRHEKPDPNSLPPNPKLCDAYGGCPHRGVRCKVSVYDFVPALPGESESAVSGSRLTDFLKSRIPGKSNPPPPISAPEEGRTWAPGDDLNDVQAMMAGKGKNLWVVAMAADNAPSAEEAQAWPGANEPYSRERAVAHAEIATARHSSNPPPPPPRDVFTLGEEERTPPPPPGSGAYTQDMTEEFTDAQFAPFVDGNGQALTRVSPDLINPPEKPAKAARTPEEALELAGMQTANAPGVEPSARAAGVEAVERAEANARDALKAECMARGLVDSSSRLGAEKLQKLLDEDKAKKQSIVPEVFKPATVPPPPVSAPIAPRAPSVAPPPARVPSFAAPAASFTLYVGCCPMKGTEAGDVIHFSEIAERVLARFRQGHPDVPHYGVMDYGKGPSTWITYVEGYLTEVARLTGLHAIVVDPRSREGADALPALERLASHVVRAFV